jgi:small subunit ribosomal protein S1
VPSTEGKTASLEDAYWESLLKDGEVVYLDTPPPWINTASQRSWPSSEDGRSPETGDWERATGLLATGETCTARVTGCNRGGLLVQFGSITGFVPTSHLIAMPGYLDPDERQEALIGRIGTECVLRVIEIDRTHGRLILSERAAVEGQMHEEVFARVKPGDVTQGCVSNLRRFGAFVDLGGYEGLVHISEMSWGRVNHPGDVVRPGDEIDVYVLDVNPEERKIQLSIKRLQPDPWEQVADRYQVGQTVRGEVTNVVSFGAFVRLEEGIEGLIHISELAEGNFLHPRNVVREGQWVSPRVLNVDPDNRRIGLSLRPGSNVEPASQEHEVSKGHATALAW